MGQIESSLSLSLSDVHVIAVSTFGSSAKVESVATIKYPEIVSEDIDDDDDDDMVGVKEESLTVSSFNAKQGQDQALIRGIFNNDGTVDHWSIEVSKENADGLKYVGQARSEEEMSYHMREIFRLWS